MRKARTGASSRRHPDLFQAVELLKTEMGFSWIRVKNAVKHRDTIKGTFELKGQLMGLSEAIGGLVGEMVSCTTGLFHEDEELEIKASIIKLKAFAEGMVAFTDGRDGATGYVRWAETEEKRIALRMSPVYPRDFMMSISCRGTGLLSLLQPRSRLQEILVS